MIFQDVCNAQTYRSSRKPMIHTVPDQPAEIQRHARALRIGRLILERLLSAAKTKELLRLSGCLSCLCKPYVVCQCFIAYILNTVRSNYYYNPDRWGRKCRPKSDSLLEEQADQGPHYLLVQLHQFEVSHHGRTSYLEF